MSGARAAYAERLVLDRANAEANPDKAWDLALSLVTLANISDDNEPLLREALAILEALSAEGRLPAEKQDWIGHVQSQLAAAR